MRHPLETSSLYFPFKCTYGGKVEEAFDYIKTNGGLDTEESYSYMGVHGKCHFNKSEIGATVSDVEYIPRGDERALMKAVAQVEKEILLKLSQSFTAIFSAQCRCLI